MTTGQFLNRFWLFVTMFVRDLLGFIVILKMDIDL